jgi:cytochrome P450
VHTEVDGQQLTEQEFSNFFMLLLNAGGDTTRNLIGGATLSLLYRPAQLQRLRADPACSGVLMAAAVEELQRFQSPLVHARRTALCDTEPGGIRIRRCSTGRMTRCRIGARTITWLSVARAQCGPLDQRGCNLRLPAAGRTPLTARDRT